MIDKQAAAELEEQIIVSLPERVANEPCLRQKLLQALQKSGDVVLRLETFEAFIEWVDEDMVVEIISPESCVVQDDRIEF
ncbi:MAG: hypothetical protein R3C62_16020 [Chloroflexota bacterium]